MAQPYLSIVIPAYNEEPRISSTLEQVIRFLSTQPYSWEIVVADDGSEDATGQVVGGLAVSNPNLRLLNLPHKGKGWAVKNAMLAASGQYRLLCDADLSVPIAQVERFLPPRMQGVDVGIGSREAEGARRIGEPGRRHLMGRTYNALVRFLAAPGVKDTQCGFKCFRGETARELFSRQTIDGFAFDVEVLFLARKKGLKLKEVGVDWYYRERSKVRIIRDSFAMTIDLLKLRWRYHRGRYHQSPGKDTTESGPG